MMAEKEYISYEEINSECKNWLIFLPAAILNALSR